MIIGSYNVAMGSSKKSNSIYSKEVEETRKLKGSNYTTKTYSKDVVSISQEAQEFLAKSRIRNGKYSEDNNNELTQSSGRDNDNDNDSENGISNESNNVTESSTPAQNLGVLTTSNTNSSSFPKILDAKSAKLKAVLMILESLSKNNKVFKDLNKQFSKQFSDFSAMSESLKGLKMQFSSNLQVQQSDSGSSQGNTLVWQVERKESAFVKEEEVTNFSSTGLVKTADGRNISFNVNVEMSRSFEQYITSKSSEEVILQDPIVINLDNAPANIGDMTFRFDIDADGNEEEISSLEKGSGFLALDKNNDGIINDGSELFGATTGNGFDELAQYDEDGNGWIDEADSIYSKLKVWTKDEVGKDVLLSLKEANVGAIYLKNVSTEFSVNDSETNEQKAQVRKTGMYLKETGEAGTLQQIDFAIKK